MNHAASTSPASTYLYGGHVHANGIRQHYLRYGGQAVSGTLAGTDDGSRFRSRIAAGFAIDGATDFATLGCRRHDPIAPGPARKRRTRLSERVRRLP